MFKIPVEYLPIACVTLNRKPVLFPLTEKAPMDLPLAAPLLDSLVFLPLAHSTSASPISLLSFNHTKHTPAPGPWDWLLLLPGTPFPQIFP